MAKIRTLRSQNKDLRVAQPSNSFLERFAKNRGKLPIIRARTRESRKKIGLRQWLDSAGGLAEAPVRLS
jgi:hypothetical protein